MNSNDPLVSVIVPVYNAQQFLDKCIRSVLNQMYTNWELILVDDGSTDESGKLCDTYAETDIRISCVHKNNGGLSSAREAGIQAMHGEFAMFIDSDDWVDVDALEQCVKIVRKYEVECVCFSYVKEYPNSSLPVHIYDDSKDFSNGNATDLYRRFWGLLGDELKHPEHGDSMASCCMKLYSRKLIKDAVFFDTKKIGCSEDTLFNIYALKNCTKAFYLDTPLYHYIKQTDGTISSTYRPRLQEQYIELFKEFNIAKETLKVDNLCVQALNNRIALTIIGIGLNELANPNKKERIKKIRHYIRSDFYKNGYQKAQKKYLPFIWKIFVFCAGHGWAFPVFMMLQGIRFLKSRV